MVPPPSRHVANTSATRPRNKTAAPNSVRMLHPTRTISTPHREGPCMRLVVASGPDERACFENLQFRDDLLCACVPKPPRHGLPRRSRCVRNRSVIPRTSPRITGVVARCEHLAVRTRRSTGSARSSGDPVIRASPRRTADVRAATCSSRRGARSERRGARQSVIRPGATIDRLRRGVGIRLKS
jgi:hypothetical protein